MKYVLLVYQGTTPLPGTERWKALPAAEQKQIYADYAELNEAPGMSVTVTAGGRSLPLCSYPAYPRYQQGDAGRAESFVCSR